jgi:hypothetical protein
MSLVFGLSRKLTSFCDHSTYVMSTFEIDIVCFSQVDSFGRFIYEFSFVFHFLPHKLFVKRILESIREQGHTIYIQKQKIENILPIY